MTTAYSRFDPTEVDGGLYETVEAAVTRPAFGPVDTAERNRPDAAHVVRVTPRDGAAVDTDRVHRVVEGLQICGFDAGVSDDTQAAVVYGLADD